MKYAIVVVMVVLMGSGAAGWWWHAKQAKAAETAAAAAANQTAKVVRRNWRLSVPASGTVASNGDVDMKAQVGGTIQLFPYCDVSLDVAPGALILQIDPVDLEAILKSKKAIVDADDAKVKEAQLTRDIAKLNLDTTRMKCEATLASANVKLTDAKAKASRTAELYDRKLASKEDLETAQTLASTLESDVANAEVAIAELKQQQMSIDAKELEIKQMQAQMVQDQANATTAQQNVDYCKVYAPKASDPTDPPQWMVSVGGGNLRPGAVIQSGSSGFSGGTTVMTLSDMSHIFVLAMVDEADYELVEIGQDVILTADSCKGVEFRGKVVRPAGKGVTISNVVKGEVKIEVTSENKRLLKLLGMTTNVEIIEAEKKDALTVPVLAVSLQHMTSGASDDAAASTTSPTTATATTQKNARSKTSDKTRISEGPFPAQVQVVKPDGSTETRDIQVGRNDGQDYLVVSGLDEGDTVMINKLGNTKWKSSPRKPSAPASGRGM